MTVELAGRITIYSITGCPHCKAAKGKLGELKLPYSDINLDEHPSQRAVMTAKTNKRTVPQIYFNERHVGGNDDFQKLTEEELQELIKYVTETPVPEDAPELPSAPDLPASAVKDEAPNDPISSGGSYASYQDKEVHMPANEDELDVAKLIKDFKDKSGMIKNHRQKIVFSIPKSFTGKDFFEYVSKKNGSDAKKADVVCESAFRYKFVVPAQNHRIKSFAKDKTLFRLVEDHPDKSLNAEYGDYESALPASALASNIRRQILQLYNKFLSPDGRAVDYQGIARSEEFKEYVDFTAKLQRVQLDKMSREQKLAFFINIYNALVIHGNVEYGFPENTLQRYKFFNNTRYLIGGNVYSLQDIENGVLRSNRKGVGMLKPPFGPNDPRLDVILTPHEPLIHFALVCGAKSCPPIKTYSVQEVTAELMIAAEAFLEGDDGCKIKKASNTVYLSTIFKWYSEDFGKSSTDTLKWVQGHMPAGEKKKELEQIINSPGHKVEFLDYNWGTNKK